MDYKEEFIHIWNSYVHREGAAELLKYICDNTDFFTAPASTKYHGACECGLVMHSLNVYHALHYRFFESEIFNSSKWLQDENNREETFAICALLHDLCKANYYTVGSRNVKNDETGRWEKVPVYQVEDRFPFGHGEKSVYMIQSKMHLTAAEAIAIRWHMGGFDDAAQGGSRAISQAYDKYPLAVMLHIADLEATYLMEHGSSSAKGPTA